MMAPEQKPVVYLFHGDDELAISEAISELKSRLGAPSSIEMNLTSLDGRSLSIEEFETSGKSLPFLAERRLTILNHPLAYLKLEANRKRVLAFLEELPEENAVVLAEFKPLLNVKERNQGKTHWLEKWGQTMGEKFFVKEFTLAKGSQLTGWIIKRARKAGGEFEPAAAAHLASLVGEDIRMADQEIVKLLTYANYDRPVVIDDIELLTEGVQEGAIFDFVDALGNRDRKKAMKEYHHLLEDQDPQRVFGMIIRQFRLLLLSREILDQNGGETDITGQLKTHPYVSRKIASQARQFSQAQLDGIYYRLLEIDSDLKTGVMSGDLNVDLLIAEVT
jgi:DNA polymerase-3 subunit delta